MNIPKSGYFHAYSLIADINSFTNLVNYHQLPAGVADYVRDVLVGAIAAIENCEGSVIGVMGDAIFGTLPDADSAMGACISIAKDVNEICKYLASSPFEKEIHELPSMKIGVEYGILQASTINSAALGTIPFCIGPATNYAARIIAVGEGNRCHIGPKAIATGFNKHINETCVQEVNGKRGEPNYQYWVLNLGNVWVEGVPEDGIRFW
jgi:class 3 adenylate cyclase